MAFSSAHHALKVLVKERFVEEIEVQPRLLGGYKFNYRISEFARDFLYLLLHDLNDKLRAYPVIEE